MGNFENDLQKWFWILAGYIYMWAVKNYSLFAWYSAQRLFSKRSEEIISYQCIKTETFTTITFKKMLLPSDGCIYQGTPTGKFKWEGGVYFILCFQTFPR